MGRETVHILVVTDDDQDADDIARGLRAGGIAAVVHHLSDSGQVAAYLGREGVYADVDPVDVMLLSLDLPGDAGYRLLRHVRACSRLRDLTVVTLSSSCDPSVINRVTRAGVNAYLTRPMDVDQLARVLQLLSFHWAGPGQASSRSQGVAAQSERRS